MTLDLLAVSVLVSLAVAFVVRKYWLRHKGRAPACGNCSECHSAD